MLRIHALYGNGKKIRVLTATMFCVCIGVEAWVLYLDIKNENGTVLKDYIYVLFQHTKGMVSDSRGFTSRYYCLRPFPFLEQILGILGASDRH